MLTKEELHRQIKDLPEEFSLDELMERLLVVEKVNRGIREIEQGNTTSDDDLDKLLEKWFE